MFQVFSVTLSTMLMLFLCIAVGFVLGKFKLSPADTDTVLSKGEFYIFNPATVLSSLLANCTMTSLAAKTATLGYAALVTVLAIALGILVGTLIQPQKSYLQNVYKYSMMFPNYGFLGLAVVTLVMGEEAVFGYVMYMLPINIGVYTYGTTLLIKGGSGKGAVLKRFANPMMFSMLLGIVLGITGIGQILPSFVTDAISSLAKCFSPLAMILTGFTVSKFGLKRLFSEKKSYVITVFRLFICPALFLTVLHFLGADETIMKYTLVAFAAPVGLNAVVFPASCGENTLPGASMAMISHIACILTIPLMFALLTAMGWI